MAEQSYDVNEDAIDAAAYTMVGTHHPDRVMQMRNIVANYLVALKAIDEEQAAEGGTRSTRGGKGHGRNA